MIYWIFFLNGHINGPPKSPSVEIEQQELITERLVDRHIALAEKTKVKSEVRMLISNFICGQTNGLNESFY